jgi:hypothetical protein
VGLVVTFALVALQCSQKNKHSLYSIFYQLVSLYFFICRHWAKYLFDVPLLCFFNFLSFTEVKDTSGSIRLDGNWFQLFEVTIKNIQFSKFRPKDLNLKFGAERYLLLIVRFSYFPSDANSLGYTGIRVHW